MWAKRKISRPLAKTYGEDVVAGGAIYTSMKTEGGKIILSFGDLGSGLMAKDGGELKTFFVAGADEKFITAVAVIKVDSVVRAADITAPLAARYAWADNPIGCNLYNKEGLPASPFRTDDWLGVV